MSTTIDQRVVEMRFDNAQFENNVKTSMSTLEKLKQSLNLNGAAKGLDGISKAANGVNLTGISTAVGTLETKFSALEVMGVTALANITNSAVNCGKKMISALTIDPIKTGFQEYETQINAVQTILANTQHKGTTINDVNKALDELNKYADLTIYNFTEMTRNIGTFTAAGLDLDTSVKGIQGIANLAAVSGSTSQQASTAMYQLSQALAAGTVKLMDWNSVVNAGMGGKVFQDAIIKTAKEIGSVDEALIKAYESGTSFRELLNPKDYGNWFTSDVLATTLSKFTKTGVVEYMADLTGNSEKSIKSLQKLGDKAGYNSDEFKKMALSLAGGNEEMAENLKSTLSMAANAEDAATKVKTFTQLWDVMKESAQSGWSQTWEIIIGDFEQAKSLLTPLADFFQKVIGKISDTRNTILEGALNSPFAKAFEGIERVSKSVDTVTKAVKNYGEVVDKVIGGEYGSGQSRWNKLAKEGYDWAKVQNMVNEKLGSSVRYTEKLKEANDDLNKSKGTSLDQLAKMSDAQLKDIGFKEDEIKAFRELQKYADKTGLSLEEIAKNTDSLSGRTLLINSFKNAGKGLATVFTAMASGWKKVFPPLSIEERSQKLYDMIAAVHKFSKSFLASEETADKFYRTFRGVFSLLKIARTLVGGPLSVAFKVLKGILGAFDIDILYLTANVGDVIYQFSEWLDSVTDFTKIFKWLKPYIQDAANSIESFSDSIKNSKYVAEAIEWIRDALLGLTDVDLTEVGRNIIEGLKKGLSEGAVGSIIDFIIDLGKQIIDRFCEVLGIHSPSKVFMAIGGFIMAGLLIGLNASVPEVREFFSGLGEKLKESFSNIDWKNVFAVGVSAAMLGLVKKLAGTLDKFAAPLKGLGELLEKTGKSLLNFSKAAKSFAFKFRAEGIKDIAIALAVLVGVVIALIYFVHKVDDPGAILTAIGLVIALAAILTALSFAVSKMSQASIELNKNGLKIGSLATTLVGISLGILLLAMAVKSMGSLDPDEIKQGFIGLTGAISTMIAFVAAYGLLVGRFQAAHISKLGSMLIKMAIAMALMVGVVKLVSLLSEDDMKKGAAFAGAFIVFVGLLSFISNFANGSVNELGSMLLKMSIAMLLLIGVVKLVGQLTEDEMIKGAAFAGAFVVFVGLLVAVTKIAGDKQIAKIGGTILAISVAMLLMTGVMKILSSMSYEDMAKGGIAITAFAAIIAGLIYVVTSVGSDAPKIAATLLAISVAIAIMAGVAIILGLIDVKALTQGIIAVGFLSAFVAGLIAVTHLAKDCKGDLIVITVAIGVITAAVALLSMIDPTKLAGATAALGILMGMFALIVGITKFATGSVGTLIVMTIAIGLIAGMIYLVGQLPVENAIAAAVSISVLLLTMSISLLLVGSLGPMAIVGAVSLLAISGVVVILAVVLYKLQELPIESTMANVKVLSLLLLAMSASLLIASIMGPMALLGAAALLIVSGVVAILAVILYKLQDLPIESTMANAKALSLLLLAMSAACAIVSFIPAALAIQGAIGLAGFVAVMTGVLTTLGKFSKIPGFNELVSSGGETLAIVGRAIGKFVGSIIGGFGEGVTSGLPSIGANLSAFMINAAPFITGIKMVDSSVLAGVGFLSGAIIALTAADLVSGIASFISGGSSFAELGTQLSAFMANATPFIAGAKTIDEGAITSAKMLAELIMTLTAADIVSAVSSFVTGENSFESFGSQLTAFGKAVVGFSNTVSANGGINEGAVNAAVNAGKMMAEFQKTLPGTGGVVQWFSGEKDMTTFAGQLIAFGNAIVQFSNKVSEGGGVNESAITAAANAGKIMVEFQKSLPNTGGVVQWFSGEKDMATFGSQLKAFGSAIVEFSNTVSGEGTINEGAITAAANAGKVMSEMQSTIEPTGGVIEFFTGQDDLATFGTQLKSFGTALMEFSDEVSGLNSSAVMSAATAGMIMANVQKAIPEKKWFDGKVSIAKFGKKIKAFGESMSDFSDKVSDIDSGAVTSAVTNAQKLVYLIRNTADLDMSGIKNFSSAITELGKIDYDSFAETFNNSLSKMTTIGLNMTTAITNGIRSGRGKVTTEANNLVNALSQTLSSKKSVLNNFGSSMMDGIILGISSKRATAINNVSIMVTSMINSVRTKASLFRNASMYLMTQFISGISKSKTKASDIMKTMLTNTIHTVREYHTNFFSAGVYVVDGFADGITANTFKAEAKAEAMAKAALKAAQEALDEHSPSKAFYKIGDYAGQGFVNALEDSNGTAYDSGYMMADYARKGLSKAIAKIQSLMNTDMDIQPTISPVVDLSNVKSGTAAIRGMFGQPLTIGASTSLAGMNAVNTIMRRNSQNGGNSDVVAAIDKLRKDVRNLEGTNNTINGLSYSDDSGISEAIGTIVRAARIERRS